jgi:hypothetical protein
MPRQSREGDKKHGDKMESFIDRTADSPAPDKSERGGDGDDPTLLQHDDEEDAQSDGGTDDRDIG